jgi:hypothetical protein
MPQFLGSPSLSDRLIALADWADSRPRWLRHGLFGAGLVYAYALSRGALGALALLVAVVFLFATGRQSEAWRFLFAVGVLAPAGGFLGGLVYTAFQPVADYLGALGRFLQRTAAGIGYAVILVFVIVPVLPLDAKEHHSVPPLANGIIAGLIGLAIGAVMSISDKDAEGRDGPTNWRFVGGLIVIAAFLMLLMYLAGWMS